MLSFILHHYRKTIIVFSVFGTLLSTKNYAQTGTWSSVTTNAPHTNDGEMLVQTDGTVLCKTSSGGSDGTIWDRLTPVNGSYKNGTWTSLPAMHYPRLYFSSQVLPDGRMYVCGGEYGTGGKYGEVYSPATNTWTIAGGATWVFPNVVSDANSELLYTGQILQASVDETGVNWNYLWDPVANTYTRGPNCLNIDNEAVWIKLPDSSVLFLDNYGQTSERYIPKTNTWIADATAGENLYDPYGFEAGAGFLLPNGQVWFIGSTPTSLYYTPSGNTSPGTWTNGPNLPGDTTGAPDAAAAMMPNGHVLLTLSHTPWAATSAAEFPDTTAYYEFDYTTNTYTQVAAPGGGMTYGNSTFVTNMVVLPDGTILYANQGSKTYYIYTPGSGPLPAGQPTISAVNRVNCDTFQITGTLFNGITEGAAYGDDWQMNTNFPIVRLTTATNTYYATTYNWNRIGAVMTGSLPDTAIFKLPAGLAAGTYSVTVIANGNPSAPFTINTALTISPSLPTTCIGASTTLTDVATIGVWSSANTTVASIGSSTGILTGGTAGTTTITYSINQCYATATVTVETAPPAITGTPNVCQGAITSLSDTYTGGTWSSSNSNATVDGSGNVTGVTAGTATISYEASAGCLVSVVTTVLAAPAAISGPSIICLGSTSSLSDAVTGGTWSSSNSNITIDGSGDATGATVGTATITYTASSGCTTEFSATVNPTASPSLTISASNGDTICAGSAASTFTANPVNPGSTPTYQWFVNGVAASTNTTYTYSPANGDVVQCILNSNNVCASPDIASSSITMTVLPGVSPAVSITSVHNDTVCATGDSVQFTAVPVFGGTSPTYLWTRNGINVATGPSFIYPPDNNDTLIVTLTSNYPCLITNTAVSETFIIHALNPTANTLSVAVSQSDIIQGRIDTFTAIANGAGASPSFQWYINGNPVAGATSYRYITDSLQNGQTVSCKETSSYLCSDPGSVFSGNISIVVEPNGITPINSGTGNFTLVPNPNNGTFTIKGSLKSLSDDQVNIIITNVLGQTIYKKTALAANGNVNEQISLTNLITAGTYQVSITSGEDHAVFQVVIEK